MVELLDSLYFSFVYQAGLEERADFFIGWRGDEGSGCAKQEDDQQ